MRISGFASGMDIDSMVTQLMTAKKEPLNKLTQQKTVMEWQQEEYRDMNVKMVTFRNKLLNYSMSSSIAAKQANLAGNTTAVSAKANTNAVAGSMSIEVTQLATSTSLSSSTGIGSVDMNAKLSTLNGGAINYDSSDQTIQVNGVSIAFNEDEDTLATLMSKINSNSATNANVFLDSATGKMSITSKTTGAAGTVTVAGDIMDSFHLASSVTSAAGIGAIDPSQTLSALKAAGKVSYNDSSIIVNGQTISFVEGTDTLTTLIDKINNDPTAKAHAKLDTATGKLTIFSTVEGSSTNVSVSGQLMDSFKATFGTGAVSTVGRDAIVNINGIETTRKSNTFTENGVEITLNSSSNGVKTSLNVQSNTDKIVDTIKSFIADYNDLLSTVNSKIDEERYLKYTPLSDEQKKEMTEDQMKLWEDKAKSGLLRRDPALTQLTNNMRISTISDVTIGSSKLNITSLGITTGDWTSKGKLIITDESRLRAAIEADPDKVMKFFTQQTTSTDPKVKDSPTNPDSGLFNRILDDAMTSLDQISQKAGTSKYSTDLNASFSAKSSISGQLRDIQQRMDRMTDQLSMQETNYYKQFTAMEQAMNRYQSQSSVFGS